MTQRQYAFLRILNGPIKGGVYVLKDLSVFDIGQGTACQVRLVDALVSNPHARIYRKGSTWTFFDLNSERGSTINDSLVAKQKLVGDEILRVGNTEMEFTFDRPGASNDAISDAPSQTQVTLQMKLPRHRSELVQANATSCSCVTEISTSSTTTRDSVVVPVQTGCLGLLSIVQGDSQDIGNTIPVRDVDVITVGRGPQCGVILSDTRVSRAHCLIENNGTTVTVTDLESLNGTFVNDRRVDKEVLQPGDCLLIGGTVVSYEHDCQTRVAVHLSEVEASSAG